MSDRQSAAIVTIGSELVEGLRVDTNSAQVARQLSGTSFRVMKIVSVGDDQSVLTEVLRDLVCEYELVVTTGGLGPTHDDVTRAAAADALLLGMNADPVLTESLQVAVDRLLDKSAAEQVLSQALVLDGAEVLYSSHGTAPGQVAKTPAGLLVLLPGPPKEMEPMLEAFLGRFDHGRAATRELGIAGSPESDVQLAAQRALSVYPGVGFTILAKIGDVHVILTDEGAGEPVLAAAAQAVKLELGDSCYSDDGSTLCETLVREALDRGITMATAESCTGGLISAAITDVPGASGTFLGGLVSYSNEAKLELLGVGAGDIEAHGAVSPQVAAAMASGARAKFDADIAVAVTGVAGPDGGTPEKPVGLVWFAIATKTEVRAIERRWFSSLPPSRFVREAVRTIAVATALDLLRHEVLKA
ncbi:MAG: nicotinamide-nucleotide amidohydrolase family protein [Coriobacteriia bacterium]|nr:nicotinamide-nucleotide amidohydrolase family protein [Coriobacteriia bacterium]